MASRDVRLVRDTLVALLQGGDSGDETARHTEDSVRAATENVRVIKAVPRATSTTYQ